jgi:hypothetical protein
MATQICQVRLGMQPELAKAAAAYGVAYAEPEP